MCDRICSLKDAVENFYRGKTVTILIGHPAGGSYDLYARLAAAHLGKYIPGHPQVLVQSKPGGAGAGAVQFLYGYRPKDGTLLGLFAETIALTQLVQPEIQLPKVTLRRETPKVGRNDPCPCGSGKKYKHCHGA